MLVLLSAGAWEWARLAGLSRKASVATGVFYAVFLLLMWKTAVDSLPVWLWWLAAVFWLLCVPVLLRRGTAGWGILAQPIKLWGGLLAVAVAWAATVQARGEGVVFLLSVLSLVWVADVAAYFGGKTMGRRKLAPQISPGKTWEGAISGWLGVLLLALAWVVWDRQFPSSQPSFFSRIHASHPGVSWLLFSVLAAASVMGDLLESMVKRSAGFKDSSRLLPGHGGVLDRVDALLPVLPLAMAFISL